MAMQCWLPQIHSGFLSLPLRGQAHQPFPTFLFLSLQLVFQRQLRSVIFSGLPQRLLLLLINIECSCFHVRRGVGSIVVFFIPAVVIHLRVFLLVGPKILVVASAFALSLLLRSTGRCAHRSFVRWWGVQRASSGLGHLGGIRLLRRADTSGFLQFASSCAPARFLLARLRLVFFLSSSFSDLRNLLPI